VVAHDCSRGSWTCFETRGLPDWTPAGGYATPAQAVVPLHVRWMLLFQDPLHGTAELLKATPRAWLSAGERIAVRRAPLGRRRLSFVVASQLGGSSEGSPSISANISLEDAGPRSGRRAAEPQDADAGPAAPPIVLYLRTPSAWRGRMVSVEVGGEPWTEFDAAKERVRLPSLGTSETVAIRVTYSRK
jgi:hypothetical protein